MRSLTLVGIISVCLSTNEAAVPTNTTSTLPIVDLGYQRHQALTYNSSNGYYNFTNIPYALPPTGERRFRAPSPFTSNTTRLENGSVGHICPPGLPDWVKISGQFIPAYLEGQSFDVDTALGSIANAQTETPDPRISEDCLVLDVLVPEKVWEKTAQGQTPEADVLVWIYGGGFVFGSKDFWGNPATLLQTSKQNGSDGVVYVAMNYRVGAFGFLSGSTLARDGDANAGLLDQRLALEWVQDNIRLFGGSKDRVTVMGESAGGASIMGHLTAYGARHTEPLFSRAIIQSPGNTAKPGPRQQEEVTLGFLKRLNVSTVADARELSSEVLIATNAALIASSSYGTFPFSIDPDGSISPAPAARLLREGKNFKDVEVLVGHNTNEGLTLVDPAFVNSTGYQTEKLFREQIAAYYPDANPDVVGYITQTLYPPVYNGSYGYTDPVMRISQFIGDAILKHTANSISLAYGNQSYAYEFAIGPALHAEDVPYTFYNGPSDVVPRPDRAVALQELLLNFAVRGMPNVTDVFELPAYGDGILRIGDEGYEVVADPTLNERNDWWQKTLYY